MAKKIPERKCMGCNGKLPKNQLIRIVRSPEGEVNVDPGGKLPGRGIYICCERKCFEKVKKTGRLANVLEVEIPEEVYDKVDDHIKAREEETSVG